MTNTNEHFHSVLEFLGNHLTAVKVFFVNMAALSVYGLTDLDSWLKRISLFIGIGYGAWKWYADYRDRKKKRNRPFTKS